MPAGFILVFLLFLDHERQFFLPLALFARTAARFRLSAKFPRTVGFLGSRLSSKDPWGLSATVAGIGIVLGAWLFLGVLRDIVAKHPLVILNIRLHNSVPLFRTTGMTWFMVALTQLACQSRYP